MILIGELKLGDIVRHIESGNAYDVVSIDESGRVFAVRQIEISNPSEWVLIGTPPDKLLSELALYNLVRGDLPRLLALVQDNQDFFGNPPAGVGCIKVAADKLEGLIKGPVKRPPEEIQQRIDDNFFEEEYD
jgi:hypothetical protein